MEYLLIAVIAFAAGLTQGLSGFGSVMVSLPLALLFWDLRVAVPLLSLLALCITTTLTLQLRGHVKLGRVIPLLAAALPGMALGAYLLKRINPAYLEVVMGITLVAFASYSLVARPRHRELASGWKWAAGFLSGILGGSVGANGPPVIVYTAMQPWDKDGAKSTLVGYFMVAGVGISSIHASFGLITPGVIKLFAAGFPAVMAGVLAGSHIYGRMSTGVYRRVVAVLLLCMGAYLLTRVGLRQL